MLHTKYMLVDYVIRKTSDHQQAINNWVLNSQKYYTGLGLPKGVQCPNPCVVWESTVKAWKFAQMDETLHNM